MSLADSLQEQFQTQLALEFAKIANSDTLLKARTKSWDHFQELGLPSRNMEVYRYVKLRKLYSQSFAAVDKIDVDQRTIDAHVLCGCEKSVLVFVNGHFYSELSSIKSLPGQVVALPMQNALRTYASLLNNHLAKSLKVETDPFVTLNGALQSGGAFIYIPPNTVVDQPIQILNLVDIKNCSAILTPRVHVFAGTNSKIDMCVVNEYLSGEKFFCNQYIDFTLEDGAQVNLNQITLGSPESAWIFDSVRASLKRDSVFRSVALTDGAATVRNDYRVELAGENGEASLNGLWMLKDSRESHTNVLISHQAPHCRSMQLYKGVLNDTSSSSFEGKILVKQAAQKTDAFQLNNNLLLSDRANADSKPNLEIFADDVKASHGATVGQLNAEQLFYLRSRGYTEPVAKSLLVNGYCQEVLDLIKECPLKEKVTGKLKYCLF
jgi:Fe-S cluster assembly protein SufD